MHITWARSGREMWMPLECLFCQRVGIRVSRLILLLLLLLLLLNHLTNLSILLRCLVRSEAEIQRKEKRTKQTNTKQEIGFKEDAYKENDVWFKSK
jgi:hypothetical protein